MMPSCDLARNLARLLLLALVAVAFALTVLPPPAAAQAAGPQAGPATAPPLSAEAASEIAALIRTLEDPAQREALVATLRRLLDASREAQVAAEAPGFGARTLGALSERSRALGEQLARTLDLFLEVPQAAGSLWQEAQTAAARQRWIEIVGKVVLVLAAGLAARWLLSRILQRPRQGVDERIRGSFSGRVVLLAVRLVLEVVPLAGFALAGYLVLPLTDPRESTRVLALALINAILIAGVVKVAARLVLAPRAATGRILPASDETANYIYIWIRRLAAISVYGYFLAEALRILGFPDYAYLFLLKVVGLVLAAMAIVLILQNRTAVAGWLRRNREPAEEAAPRLRLSDMWHVPAVLYVVAIYGIWALQVGEGFSFLLRATLLTLVVLALGQVAAVAVRRLVDRGFRLSDDLKARFPGLEARANRYLPVLQRILRIAILFLVVLAILQVWGVDVIAWLGTDTGREIGARALTIVLVIGVALVLWELISAAIESYLLRKNLTSGPEGGGRLLTLLPIMRNAVRLVLGVVVVMVVLSELGVDIAPLLAGAGIVGLAIGFGSQALVKDVITGVFILLEETVRVGDVIEAGGHSGLVERLTIRTIVLRGLDGVVHVVPFGEVATIKNMTMGYSFALIDVRVSYRENIDNVIEVLKDVAAGLQSDEKFAGDILEPLDVIGVNSFNDSAINMQVRFKTRPIKQWSILREFNRRMKQAFDERGIEIPYPHRTLYFGVDKEGAAPPARILRENPQEPGGAGREGQD